MKDQFLILMILPVILCFMSACSKFNDQTEQLEFQNSKSEFSESYRERIKARAITTKATEETKKPIEKTSGKSSGKTIQEKINNLRVFSTNDLLSPAEVALLSSEDVQKYITKLADRVFDYTEKMSLDIYNYMKDTGLLNLCDRKQKGHIMDIAAAYINNKGKGFDEIYKFYDEYLQNNILDQNDLLMIAHSYINYLNDSQDYQKWQELLNGPFYEIADSFKNNYNIGKMTEPFLDYQAKVQSVLLNADQSSEQYNNALSDLAERIAREELYPDYKFKAKNIKKYELIKYTSDGSFFHCSINRGDRIKDPLQRMFIEFKDMMDSRNRGWSHENNPELERYIEAYSNAYKKLATEYGEPM